MVCCAEKARVSGRGPPCPPRVGVAGLSWPWAVLLVRLLACADVWTPVMPQHHSHRLVLDGGGGPGAGVLRGLCCCWVNLGYCLEGDVGMRVNFGDLSRRAIAYSEGLRVFAVFFCLVHVVSPCLYSCA